MKSSKLIRYSLFTIFFLWWFFLSHVTFFSSSLENGERNKDDYKVVFYYPLPINFIGIYYAANYSEPYFAVLYKDGKYIGQSSPFYMENNSFLMGDNYSFPNEKRDYFYIVCADCEGYDISIKEKKWWSQILQYFH
ncbi:hypothetical protein ID856_16705 [Xenorhabdus sp. 18]|uniref:DUF6201 family protein n=1 Tax=Xenorhabdus doucetiae TaxID=351671 RepID=UPI001992AFBA|nr:DUF6201 family protein [Xenorhabdus sp. 18]MBD2798148.1 hypothetical protein [Xenorhabdus sp. 18]